MKVSFDRFSTEEIVTGKIIKGQNWVAEPSFMTYVFNVSVYEEQAHCPQKLKQRGAGHYLMMSHFGIVLSSRFMQTFFLEFQYFGKTQTKLEILIVQIHKQYFGNMKIL